MAIATIKTAIALYDGVTSPLQSMQRAMSIVINSFESMQRTSGRAVDVSSIQQARDELARAEAAFDGIEESIRKANEQQQNFNQSIKNGSSSADILSNKIEGMVKAYAGIQGIQKLVGLSDRVAGNTARLSLMVDDGGSVKELEDKIFASAQRARGNYLDTVDVVAKLGITAGKAFGSNDEIIAFTELMNKNFIIAGASAQEQSAAMYQLTQAMASGRLQGDEYRSIIENAPLLASSIEDYMRNVQGAKGTMKDWAADGMLTADVIKAALFQSADEINERFETMPMTWSQVWTQICNSLIRASQPLLDFINLLANNWSILEPIVVGVTIAIGLYTAALVLNKAVQAGSALIEGVRAAKLMLSTGATFAATAAQHGFNAALLACPITWIIIAIIAIIALIYAVVACINKARDTTISATGVIIGALFAVGAFLLNIVIGTINAIIQLIWTFFVEPFIGIIEWILNVVNGGFDSFGDAVASLIGNIISWFLSLGMVVTKIIDAIFGTNWTGGLKSLQDKVLQWGKNENSITLSREMPDTGLNRIAYTDAYNAGYKFGQGIDSKIGGMFGGADSMDDLLSGVDDTATNTGAMADSMDFAEEDLRYLRDIAEREAINRFTTAEVTVNQTNQNHINSGMDLDGIMDRWSSDFSEVLLTTAEGVHN